MKTRLFLVAWFILFTVSWPLALVALVVWPLVWLVSQPLALLGMGVEVVFVFLKSIFYLPTRIFGHQAR